LANHRAAGVGDHYMLSEPAGNLDKLKRESSHDHNILCLMPIGDTILGVASFKS
jgi:hypothetical protein